MVSRVLCVAEKPSIAKAVAFHLGRNVQTRSDTGVPWLKNYEFDFEFSLPWGQCKVTMTSVAGHIKGSDFEGRYRGWESCQPQELYDATIVEFVHSDKLKISRNIEKQARYAMALFIWTDCDREGEHIGSEIRDIALSSKPEMQVKRARFSNIERAHVYQAAMHPIDLDERQVHAVAARIELDLRVGASFTRMQTKAFKAMIQQFRDGVISYGSCQFPTLGFIVDRYFRVKNFQPETFWKIQVFHEREGKRVSFHWKRVHLFDRMITTIIFERCIEAGQARVIDLQKKPTSKWRPLPLTTVELQKMGSRFLHMDSQAVMKTAEDLYTHGFISYPRTETDQFDPQMDLRTLVDRQTSDHQWGNYAQSLLNGGYRNPRSGSHNDKAHPPIHPVNYITPASLERPEERKVYEFVVRRFLACVSEDARGESTTVALQCGPEIFTANGLLVLQRNYLDVYPYDKWESSQQLPDFQQGETFQPTEARMNEGQTSPPDYLTEPELIALMDANGIGTDATMAEHIAKIKEREYVVTKPPGNSNQPDNSGGGGGRGGAGRGRGRGRGRGGTNNNATSRTSNSGGNNVFIPTTLGVALIVGYDDLNLDTSVSKPFLRKEMEAQMRAICSGEMTKHEVVNASIQMYRDIFIRTSMNVEVLKAAVRKYVLEPQQQQ
ncbi:MAG: DNA topoisomerase [Alyxoria varia]|nr:MAG: DNA topoisomerase [Alyxoria varia]